MSAEDRYCEYLKGRNRLGLWYRRYWLYPRLCRHVSGQTLDVGCGIGDFLSYRPGTIGVDINASTVEWCREQGLDARLTKPDLLPFESASFDTVVLDNVLEHLSSPRPLLSEIHRVLRPAATLLVGVPGKRGYASDPDHKIFYDSEALISVVDMIGFSLKHLFHAPFRSAWLDTNMRQYCVYGVFQRD